jgi:hypothetical protein
MSNKPAEFVGTSFKLGYRFQSYWTDSMAIAFFAAEVGTGLFLVSYYFDLMIGMILGVAFTGTLKPYFHLAHMGVPSKSIRALLRPDRSWISRGALAIGFFVVPALFFLLNKGDVFAFANIGLPMLDTLAQYTAVAAALVVIVYQGFAMSDSESFTLWASPFLPASSAAYAMTAGSLLTLIVGWGSLAEQDKHDLAAMATILLFIDLWMIISILNSAKKKSEGGRVSVELLMKDKFAPWFRNLVIILGLIVPIVIMLIGSSTFFGVLLSAAAMLTGFMAFRFLMFKAAVYEPITHDIAGKFGLI